MEIQMSLRVSDSLPNHPFWTFSQQLYKKTEVEHALILLQYQFGLNANVILFFCWFSFNGQGAFSQSKVRELLLRIRPWHERVVLPLRRLRDRLKPFVDTVDWAKGVRQAILLEELEAEHAEQLMISEFFSYEDHRIKSAPQKAADIFRSLSAYCRMSRVDLDAVGCDAVAAILSIIFSKIPLAELEKTSRKRLMRRRVRGGTVGTQLWLDI
jgi:uncharacterized protein (TIGR02444 family)